MAKEIRRFEILNCGPGGSYFLPMPAGAEVLHVGLIDSQPRMWALVDPAAEPEERHFRLLREGVPPVDDPALRYVGAFCAPQVEWDAAWYVFEILKGA